MHLVAEEKRDDHLRNEKQTVLHKRGPEASFASHSLLVTHCGAEGYLSLAHRASVYCVHDRATPWFGPRSAEGKTASSGSCPVLAASVIAIIRH